MHTPEVSDAEGVELDNANSDALAPRSADTADMRAAKMRKPKPHGSDTEL